MGISATVSMSVVQARLRVVNDCMTWCKFRYDHHFECEFHYESCASITRNMSVRISFSAHMYKKINMRARMRFSVNRSENGKMSMLENITVSLRPLHIIHEYGSIVHELVQLNESFN